jgi:cytochrome c biogenesis protein CcdA/thiol-disulfide isomerase/thioredoxin
VILFLLAYLGGVLTIASPCILPVLPFVLARADQPFIKSGLPLLAGMALTFAAVATLAAVGGGWAVEANQYGRFAAIGLLAIFGVILLFPALSNRMTRPLVALGGRLSQAADRSVRTEGSKIAAPLLLGVATGLLWAPCAGPILGLILTGAALQGPNVQTSLLLLSYAAGAATSLAVALLAGGRVFAAMKRSLGFSEWVRRGLGAAVLAGVAAIAFGVDTGFLTRISLGSTTSLEQGLLDKLHPASTSAEVQARQANAKTQTEELPVEGRLPPLSGAVTWLNSPPLTREDLRGKVVLIDFWTYSCINCLRAIPYVQAWAEKYKNQGLVVIGVHSPEFAFEKSAGNVKKAVADLKIGYPVAVDSDYAIWRAFGNHYWPAHYFIDGKGAIRHHHFGEGDYDKSEQVIQRLLAEAGKPDVPSGLVSVNAQGAQATSDIVNVQSPETYIGYERAGNFASPGGAVKNSPHIYTAGMLQLNEWGLTGDWTIGRDNAVLNEKEGSIVYKFQARDLHLVLRPPEGKMVRFLVKIDGKPPGSSHGSDVDPGGEGAVSEDRLYQLIRQSGAVGEHTFEIEFLDPGVEAYAFTFG